jgi:hypothetical protein
MPKLTITAAAELGVLSLQVSGGWARNSWSSFLTSSHPKAVLWVPGDGEYVIVATRPGGDRLVRLASVQDGQGELDIQPDTDYLSTPVSRATVRGMLPSAVSIRRDTETANYPVNIVDTSSDTWSGATSADRALRAVTRNLVSLSDRSHTAKDSRGITARTPKKHFLRTWTLEDGFWRPYYFSTQCIADGPYLWVEPPIAIDGRGAPAAIGLLDPDGFGPIVICPPFHGQLDVMFRADGLIKEAAFRAKNPSAVRVPVAAAVPKNALHADLLSAVDAPALADAENVVGNSDEPEWLRTRLNVPTAPDFRWRIDFAEATLWAHFLMRFNWRRVPVGWLEELTAVVRDAADGPTLLAWRLATEGTLGDRRVTRRTVRGLLNEACRRPVSLFARTRELLTQACRVYGPVSADVRDLYATRSKIAQPELFVDFGADAGGVEAFWGHGPSSPGLPDHPLEPSREDIEIEFDGAFSVVKIPDILDRI